MTINWQDVITSLGGNVILLAAVGWLIKTLLSHRFALEAEKFKVEVKATADIEIERVRALLTRASRVHERQVDTLVKLHRHFSDAQGWFQAMARGYKLVGEVSMDEYGRKCAEAVASARDTFADGRLLIPPDLAPQCARFFESLFKGQTDLDLAQHSMVVNGHQRAGFWDDAQKIALKELPSILDQIERGFPQRHTRSAAPIDCRRFPEG